MCVFLKLEFTQSDQVHSQQMKKKNPKTNTQNNNQPENNKTTVKEKGIKWMWCVEDCCEYAQAVLYTQSTRARFKIWRKYGSGNAVYLQMLKDTWHK